jgi:hypothetical protein
MRCGIATAAAALLVAYAAGTAAPAGAGEPAASVRARFVGEVERGLAAADARWGWRGWYRDTRETKSWSSVWDTIHLLEARVGLYAAAPSAVHRQALIHMALGAEGYANPRLANGLGGFTTGYALHGEQGTMWFDDAAWIGLAFFDVYEQTQVARFLHDAEIAFRYAYRMGWDRVGGGIWWNSRRTVKAAESVNTAALLAIELYDAHRGRGYLRAARRLVDWANVHLRNRGTGLYDNHPKAGVPISYNQSPMLAALVRLCRDGEGGCTQAAELREATLEAFGAELNQPPQYDGTYLRYLMAADRLRHDPRIAEVVLANAVRIEQNAVDADGFYLRAWDGGMDGIAPGLVSVHGAALEALAWAAVAAPAR